MKRQLVIEIICFLFILLFVYAAVMKWMDVEKFTVQLGQSPMLMPFAKQAAIAVPATELVIAAMLIFRRTRLPGLYASFTLMVMFSVYIAVLLLFARHVPCSCGGILGDLSHGQHLVFNIGFVMLAIAGTVLMAAPLRDASKPTGTKMQYTS